MKAQGSSLRRSRSRRIVVSYNFIPKSRKWSVYLLSRLHIASEHGRHRCCRHCFS